MPMHLIPTRPLPMVAMAFADGGLKYGPYNWRTQRISASVYWGAMLRHQMCWWGGRDVSADSKVYHLAASIACQMMILDVMSTPMFRDNRPPSLVDVEHEFDLFAFGLPELAARTTTRFGVHDIQGADV